jgi:hypothetical protein
MPQSTGPRALFRSRLRTAKTPRDQATAPHHSGDVVGDFWI